MADKLSESELKARLDRAATQVEVGAKYRHYKGNYYLVNELAVLEATGEVGVIYKALYGEGITFIRVISSWLEKVEVEGKHINRFEKA
jgi:hypothetical protein